MDWSLLLHHICRPSMINGPPRKVDFPLKASAVPTITESLTLH